jgi:hypothetical protein
MEDINRPDYPKIFFVEERYAGDPTNWFIPNKAGVEAILRSAGFAFEANPEREVYLCRRGERRYAVEPPPAIAVDRRTNRRAHTCSTCTTPETAFKAPASEPVTA